ncbi:hypothetical protein NDU88_008328, partial [Pleurodeles waltl]
MQCSPHRMLLCEWKTVAVPLRLQRPPVSHHAQQETVASVILAVIGKSNSILCSVHLGGGRVV